jgi:hypothetical protein
MPEGTRGALIRDLSTPARGILLTSWVPTSASDRLAPGQLLLSWSPTKNGTDVTARLRLVNTEVLLATWPKLRGDWTVTVHPTLYEVHCLHSALRLATAALDLSNHLAS